jgi:hypothetical protein
MKQNHAKSSIGARDGSRGLGRYLRWSLTAVAVGLGLSSFVGWLRFLERSGRVYALPRASMAIERTPAALARGEHLARGLAGCAVCHGADFGGRVFVETPLFRAVSPNLSRQRQRDWALFGARLGERDRARGAPESAFAAADAVQGSWLFCRR